VALGLISPLLAEPAPVLSPTITAQAAFWHGKLLKGLGDAGWRQSIQKVSRLAPGSYYDFRARALLAGEPDSGPLMPGFLAGSIAISDPQALYTAEAAERRALLEWAMGLTATRPTVTHTVTTNATLTPAPGALTSNTPTTATMGTVTPGSPDADEQDIAVADPELARATVLLELGYADEAYRSLLAVGQRMAATGDAYGLAQLVIYARYHADARTAMLLAEMLAGAGDPFMLPALLLKTMYPTPYTQPVLEEARARDVDPLLIYALIRQESQFVPDARSHADARGLTQVIPSTGEGIAAQLDDGDFSVQDLYLPYVSVRYGVYYLTSNAPTFDRRLLPTLAAYNGGPGNAARWLAGSALIDPDLYVERIDLPETQDYLIRVYQNYGFYRYVYARGR
jgi:soluble lytic murein transglycosylase-like protein